MKTALLSWEFWALLSAGFAALTAVLAEVGVSGVNPDFATFVRAVVVLLALGAILLATGQWQAPGSVSGRSYVFLVLSGLSTGGSWVCYFRALKLGDAARVAPIDKLSVVLVALFGVAFHGERLSASGWPGVPLIAAGAVPAACRGWRNSYPPLAAVPRTVVVAPLDGGRPPTVWRPRRGGAAASARRRSRERWTATLGVVPSGPPPTRQPRCRARQRPWSLARRCRAASEARPRPAPTPALRRSRQARRRRAMATTPVFLAFAGGTSATATCSRTGHRTAPDRLAVPWHAPDSGGTPAAPRPVDERNPWAGVTAMRLRRAALAMHPAL